MAPFAFGAACAGILATACLGLARTALGSPGLTQLSPQSAISQLEALGYNVQVNVGTVYVDANCPEGDD